MSGWGGRGTYLVGAFGRQTLGGTEITKILWWGSEAEMVPEKVEGIGLLLNKDSFFMFDE